ncbi:hypothetical protein SDC9_95716 [bioreactor metagenome]|uniref:Uncharacterized protein n=1 Tax=bioreactor metagenome TaxID=1076179 RepID=A0A645A738_9ZZZZ
MIEDGIIGSWVSIKTSNGIKSKQNDGHTHEVHEQGELQGAFLRRTIGIVKHDDKQKNRVHIDDSVC